MGRGGRGNSGGYGGYHRSGGRGYRGYRGRRDAAIQESEQIFAEMEALDSIDDCGKLYLCQLAAAMEKAELSQEERKLIEALHQDGQVKVESAESAFQMAVQLGLQYKSQSKCNTRYARCLL